MEEWLRDLLGDAVGAVVTTLKKCISIVFVLHWNALTFLKYLFDIEACSTCITTCGYNSMAS